MTTATQYRRTYDYRTVKIATIWSVIGFSIVGIVFAFNAYRAQAMESIEKIKQAAPMSANNASSASDTPIIKVASPAESVPAPVAALYKVDAVPGCQSVPIQHADSWIVCWGGAKPQPELFLPSERERFTKWLDVDTGTTYRITY